MRGLSSLGRRRRNSFIRSDFNAALGEYLPSLRVTRSQAKTEHREKLHRPSGPGHCLPKLKVFVATSLTRGWVRLRAPNRSCFAFVFASHEYRMLCGQAGAPDWSNSVFLCSCCCSSSSAGGPEVPENFDARFLRFANK